MHGPDQEYDACDAFVELESDKVCCAQVRVPPVALTCGGVLSPETVAVAVELHPLIGFVTVTV